MFQRCRPLFFQFPQMMGIEMFHNGSLAFGDQHRILVVQRPQINVIKRFPRPQAPQHRVFLRFSELLPLIVHSQGLEIVSCRSRPHATEWVNQRFTRQDPPPIVAHEEWSRPMCGHTFHEMVPNSLWRNPLPPKAVRCTDARESNALLCTGTDRLWKAWKKAWYDSRWVLLARPSTPMSVLSWKLSIGVDILVLSIFVIYPVQAAFG